MARIFIVEDDLVVLSLPGVSAREVIRELTGPDGRPIVKSLPMRAERSPGSDQVPLDGYTRWVEAVLAVVVAPHDVSNLEAWPSVLPTARSLAAIRHWCRAVSLPAGGSLDLGRSIHAFVQSQRTGRDPRRLLMAATKETALRFWRRAGQDDTGRLPGTLDETLERQQFIRDRGALEALRAVVHNRFPELP